AGAAAVALLAEPRVDAGHRLRQGKHLLLGHELVEELGLVRHGAEAAADVNLETAPPLPVDLAGLRDEAHVVDVHEGAGVVAAAREGDLELAPEVLRVRMAEQEPERRIGVGRDSETLVAA